MPIDLAAYAPLNGADMTASVVLRDDVDDKLLVHNQTQAAGTPARAANNAARKAMDDDKRKIRALLKANGVFDDVYNWARAVNTLERAEQYVGSRLISLLALSD